MKMFAGVFSKFGCLILKIFMLLRILVSIRLKPLKISRYAPLEESANVYIMTSIKDILLTLFKRGKITEVLKCLI